MKYLIALLLMALPLMAAQPSVTYGSVTTNVSPNNLSLRVASLTNYAATASAIAMYDANKKLISGAAPVQGDVIYFNGTSWVNLAPGVSGRFLQTQGAGANPTWAVSSGGDAFLANDQTFTGENTFTNTTFADRVMLSLLWGVAGDASDGAGLLLATVVNDYALDAGVVRMTVSGSGSVGELTGMIVPAEFEHGNMTILINSDLVDNILIRNQDARSIDTNRFYMSNDVLLRPNDSIFVRYDITKAGWRILDSQSSSANWFASGTTNSTLAGISSQHGVVATNSVTSPTYTVSGSGGLNVDGSAGGILLNSGASGTTNSGALRVTGDLRLDATLTDGAGSTGTTGQSLLSNGASDPAWGPNYVYSMSFSQSVASTILAQAYYLGPSSSLNTTQARFHMAVPIAGRIVGYSLMVRTGATTTAPTPNTIDVWLNNAQVPGGQYAYVWNASETTSVFQSTTATAVAVNDKIEIRMVFGGAPSSATLGQYYFQVMIQAP